MKNVLLNVLLFGGVTILPQITITLYFLKNHQEYTLLTGAPLIPILVALCTVSVIVPGCMMWVFLNKKEESL